MTSISAFFPCFNDESTIESMVRGVAAVLNESNIDGDVIVVDDGSTDGSAQVLADLARDEPRLHVVTHSTNQGYGAALQSGFAAASGEWVFYTDGDGQYDPGELRLLLPHARAGVDVVQGFKLSRSDNVARRFIGRLYHHTVALLFGLRVRDTDCDFRLIRRSALEKFTLTSTTGVICVELVHSLQRAGAQFVEVGVHHYARTSGRSTFFRPSNVAKTLLALVALWLHRTVASQTGPAPRPHRKPRVAGLWAATALVFAFIFATALRPPLDRADEAWFLWVAVRANSGAHLYHDVYYVSTPLAIWFMQGAVWLFGAHIWVERALVSAAVTASVILTWLIAERIRVRPSARVPICAAVILFGTPVAHFASAYSTLAVALCLATLLATLAALSAIEEGRPPTRQLISAGILCALAVASKPNLGLAAFVAAVIPLVVAARARDADQSRWKPVGIFAAASGATLAALAAPFLVNGTLPALVSDVFAGKGGVYFAVEGSILPGFTQSFGLILEPRHRWGADVEHLVTLIPFVALALLATAAFRARRSWTGAHAAIFTFAAVGFVTAAPDFGAQHLTEAVPLLLALPALAVAMTRRSRAAPSRWPTPAVAGAVTLVAIIGMIGVVSWARRPLAYPRNGLVAEQNAAVAGLVTTRQLAYQTHADLAELRHHTNGTVYLAFLSASYYYLVGHLHDPTAFDYPERSDLGAEGEAGLINLLTARHVQWACVANSRPTSSAIRPFAVYRYIRTRFRLVERLHVCDLYTRASSPREVAVPLRANRPKVGLVERLERSTTQIADTDARSSPPRVARRAD